MLQNLLGNVFKNQRKKISLNLEKKLVSVVFNDKVSDSKAENAVWKTYHRITFL